MAKIRELIDQSQEEVLKEQLGFLITCATGKLNEQKQKIENIFLNPATEEKIRVIPNKQIKWYDEYRCNVKKGASDSVDKVIDSFFSGEKGLLDGFKSVVKIGLDTILGNETAGESQQNIYVVFVEHNAIIRVDISCWRYNYSSEGIIANVKDVFCCSFCKSVVDHKTVPLDTLLYLMSEYIGDDEEKVRDYILKLKTLYKELKDLDPEDVADNAYKKMSQLKQES